MHLTRCKDQKRATLDDFYAELAASNNPFTRKLGLLMLEWIACLRALPDPRIVYGLTSHYRLCLLSEDDYTSPWFVTIVASDESSYWVEYLIPAHEAPWPNACVRGEATSMSEAVSMVITAMEKSGGWK